MDYLTTDKHRYTQIRRKSSVFIGVHLRKRTDLKKSEKVSGRVLGERLKGNTVKVRQKLSRLDDIARFVAFPSKRYRRQERAIGLDQQPIERHYASRVAEIFGLFESHIAGE